MIRADNPYNQALESLTAFMEFELESDTPICKDALDKLTEKGGHLKCISKEDSRYLVSLSHKYIDGRGLTFLFDKLCKSRSARVFSKPGESCSNINEEFSFHSYWLPKMEYKNSNITFTLDLALRLIKQYPQLNKENIGIVVNLEETSFDKIDSIWGNSIIVTPISAQTILSFEGKPKDEWKYFLKDRAHRTLRIMKRKSFSDVKFESLVISSIGNLTKLPWLTPETASSLRLGATPSSNKTTNIFVWSNHGTQSLMLCGSEEHWLYRKKNEVSGIWKKMFIRK